MPPQSFVVYQAVDCEPIQRVSVEDTNRNEKHLDYTLCCGRDACGSSMSLDMGKHLMHHLSFLTQSARKEYWSETYTSYLGHMNTGD